MDEILCFDKNGNSIEKLSQWDSNLELYINWEYSSSPVFQYCNINTQRILVVKGIVDSNNKIAKSNIPNIFLQEACPIVCFVYLEQDTPTGYLSGETIYTFQIPVREKPKPEHYEYFENTEYISWVALEKNMKSRVDQLVDYGYSVVGEYEDSVEYVGNIKNETILASNNAKTSEDNARISEDNARISEDNAEEYASTATDNASIAINQATISKSYAVGGTGTRENEDSDNSKYYYEQSKAIAESLSSIVQNLDIALVSDIKEYLGI